MKERSTVSVVNCPDYDPVRVGPAVERLLKTLEPLGLPRGSRLLLKPNCLSSDQPPEKEINTRAAVIEAVGRYLKDHYRAELVIADSAGLGSGGRSLKAYEIMGLPGVAERLGAELVEIDGAAQGLISLESPTGLVLKRFKATALLEKVDAVVNLPKLKTHILTGLTGSIKNCLGLLPGGLKKTVHVQAPTGRQLSRAMVDIFAAVKPQLHIMDAITAMEGTGPSQGKPRPVGRLLAGFDGVAVDAAAAVIMGLNPAKTEIIRAAAAAGLGRAGRDEIELLGADWNELPVSGFKKAFSGLQSWLAEALPQRASGRLVEFFAEARPRTDWAGCELCGQCVRACPMKAITLRDERIYLDAAKCIECYCCLEHCPAQGLWVPRNLGQKIFGRRMVRSA